MAAHAGWTGLVGSLIGLFGNTDAKAWLDLGSAAIRQGSAAREKAHDEHAHA